MVKTTTAPKPKAKAALRTKNAYAEENFYYQLKAGGECGWNDQYIDPKDSTEGTDRFYLKFHGASIASIELMEKDGEKQTKIVVFGSPQKSPGHHDRDISQEERGHLFEDVMLAIQGLYQV